MAWNEIIANIIMSPINFVAESLDIIKDWWGAGVALAVGITAIILLRKKTH